MDDFVAILKTEYSTAFDEHRKKAILTASINTDLLRRITGSINVWTL